MYNIAICDDDRMFIQYMEELLLSARLDERDVRFYEYYSVEELISGLEGDTTYDLLILDMKMKKMDDNETARQFRRKHSNTVLAFCLGGGQLTEKSFEVIPFRYLLKKYSNSQMLREVNLIIEEVRRTKTRPYILGSYHCSNVKLKPEEILYIAVAKHGSYIHVCPESVKYDFESKITSKEKVEEFYNILKDFGFVYAHNSYIVNLKHIKRKTLTELELVDGTVLSIARSKEKELRKAMAGYFTLKSE